MTKDFFGVLVSSDPTEDLNPIRGRGQKIFWVLVFRVAQRAAFGDHFMKRLPKKGGSRAAPLCRPRTCRLHLPGRDGTGQLAVQASNRDRSLRSWRQYRWPRSNLFSAAIRTSRPPV